MLYIFFVCLLCSIYFRGLFVLGETLASYLQFVMIIVEIWPRHIETTYNLLLSGLILLIVWANSLSDICIISSYFNSL
jgi:hypothetical protein